MGFAFRNPLAALQISIGAAVLLSAGAAKAHADLDPLHDHRVLSLHVTDAGIVATYVLAFSAATSEELRREFDLDHDGQLGERELAGLTARLMSLAAGLTLVLDGASVPLSFTSKPPSYEGALGTVLGSREIAARWEQRIFPATEGEHRFGVGDATKLPRPGDLHVRISGEGKTRVVGIDHRVEARLSFLEAAVHRQDTCQMATCHVEVRFLGGGAAPRNRGAGTAGLFLAVLGGGSLGAYAWWRRRHSSGPV